jgi:hypothetical protein
MHYAMMIVTHTPAWVFLILGYLIWMGVGGLGTRTLPVARVWLTPALFIVWGLSSVFGGHDVGAVAPA